MLCYICMYKTRSAYQFRTSTVGGVQTDEPTANLSGRNVNKA